MSEPQNGSLLVTDRALTSPTEVTRPSGLFCPKLQRHFRLPGSHKQLDGVATLHLYKCYFSFNEAMALFYLYRISKYGRLMLWQAGERVRYIQHVDLHMFHQCSFHLLYPLVHVDIFQKITSFFIIITVFAAKASQTHCLGLIDVLFCLLFSWVVHWCMNQSITDFQAFLL